MAQALKQKYRDRKATERHQHSGRTGNSHGPTPKKGAKKRAGKRQGMGARKHTYGPF